ncbi:hypothetical protein TSOC_007021 [Tetrabaena socialis]|uniref:Uncharacterized protein n=1 Tax=Tetrabaena socialis TaxID=47790 RepID=A0A2J8A240_9CHLO|nr:hypothetical protein TSOC_007021 [Tetrabaena socialis]|eukprot:PNH06583.1 hypothetical protein TSOC_007021 [Tetrabaena socialis]
MLFTKSSPSIALVTARTCCSHATVTTSVTASASASATIGASASTTGASASVTTFASSSITGASTFASASASARGGASLSSAAPLEGLVANSTSPSSASVTLPASTRDYGSGVSALFETANELAMTKVAPGGSTTQSPRTGLNSTCIATPACLTGGGGTSRSQAQQPGSHQVEWH